MYPTLVIKSKGKSNPNGSHPLRPCSGSQETREEEAAVRDSERTWQQFRHSLIAQTCFLSSLLAFSVPLPTTPRKKPLSGRLEVGWFQDRSHQQPQTGHRAACERLRGFGITSAPSEAARLPLLAFRLIAALHGKLPCCSHCS